MEDRGSERSLQIDLFATQHGSSGHGLHSDRAHGLTAPVSLLLMRKMTLGRIFSDQAMTLVAIDRLVHHANELRVLSAESCAQTQARSGAIEL
jgi:hypothetical protein